MTETNTNAIENDDNGPGWKLCPTCRHAMSMEDTGYVYHWTCKRDECPNAEGYWSVYDWDRYGLVLEVREAVGTDAAARLAWELDKGELSDLETPL